MTDIEEMQEDKRRRSSAVVHALLDRLEAAEKDAAHQKALADSALRVAEGWEEKCNTLRAKIAEMEQQEPVMWANSSNINSSRINKERGGSGDQHTCSETQTAYHHAPLYALPGAQPAPSAPSEEAAAEMGANGGHVVEAERLAFEAWMRGHCWKLGAKWTGTEYRSAFEKGGMVDMHAMRTRELWAAWRDRAALAAAPEAKP